WNTIDLSPDSRHDWLLPMAETAFRRGGQRINLSIYFQLTLHSGPYPIETYLKPFMECLRSLKVHFYSDRSLVPKFLALPPGRLAALEEIALFLQPGMRIEIPK